MDMILRKGSTLSVILLIMCYIMLQCPRRRALHYNIFIPLADESFDVQS